MFIKLEVGKTYVSEDNEKFDLITSFTRSSGDEIFVSSDDFLFYDDGSCFHGDGGYEPTLVCSTDESAVKDAATRKSRSVMNKTNGAVQSAINSLREWGEAVFGPVEPKRIVERANEEMIELRDEVGINNRWTDKALEEAADVLVILTRAPGLWEAVIKKMTINFNRQWDLRGDGTGYHIPKNMKG